MINYLEIEGNKFLVKIRSTNKPKVSASIVDGKITITLPDFLNREERFKEILKMKELAIKSIKKNLERFKSSIFIFLKLPVNK